MSRFIDSLITYRILKMLVTPFEETEAFKLGIIDSKGKELKKMSQLNTVDEKDAFTLLHRMVFRLKKIIEKVPIENKKLVNFAAALSLIKENYLANKEPINLEEMFFNRLSSDLQEELFLVETFINKPITLTFKQFLDEEIPANNAGTQGVDGFTPETLGVRVKKKRNLDNKLYKIFKRSEVKNVGLA